MNSTKTGTDLIAAERERQITEKGYDAAHDAGAAGGLIAASASYAWSANAPLLWTAGRPPAGWPWAPEAWRPTGTASGDLIKAGALAAAALDSLPNIGTNW